MKYQVRLNIPTAMWAIVEIDADNEEVAKEMALRNCAAGLVSFEFTGFDNADAEVSDVEVVE